MRVFAMVLVLLEMSLAGSAFADVLIMTTGRKLEGRIVSEDGDSIKVERRPGWIETVKRTDVKSIERTTSTIEQYETEKAKAVDANHVDAYLALAAWCAENRMAREEKLAYEAVLELEADNEMARKALGYVRADDGTWSMPVKQDAPTADREEELQLKDKLDLGEPYWIEQTQKVIAAAGVARQDLDAALALYNSMRTASGREGLVPVVEARYADYRKAIKAIDDLYERCRKSEYCVPGYVRPLHRFNDEVQKLRRGELVPWRPR